MNIIDIIIIAILVYGLLSGMYKGMLASALKLLGFAGAWIGARSLYAKVAYFALSNKTLMAVLNQYLEPETYFSDRVLAGSNVAQVVAGSEETIRQAIASLGNNFGFLNDALSENLRHLSFQNLGLNTVSEYFNQTLWVAVFNVGAFVLCFAVLYLLISILINLLDKVICFPLLKRFDWLIGGVFGLLRASVIVVLVLNILPNMIAVVNPEMAATLTGSSKLYAFCSQFDLLRAGDWLARLVRG